MTEYRLNNADCEEIERRKHTPGFRWHDLEGFKSKSWEACRAKWRRWKDLKRVTEARNVEFKTRPQRNSYPRQLFKAAVYDIECTDFKAEGYAGIFVCCSILPTDSDNMVTPQLQHKDTPDDRRALWETIRELWKYDLLIAQNGKAFDLNWLRTRLAYYDWPTPRAWWHFDTYQTAKSWAFKTGKSLGNLTDFFGLGGVKTTVYRTSWSKVFSPYEAEFKDAIEDIVYHCEQDVIMTRNLWDVLMPIALELNPNQIKVTKWKTGITDFETWDFERVRRGGRAFK
jgi:uncharacterized protein YprB with RNaseH-like and TPR domain